MIYVEVQFRSDICHDCSVQELAYVALGLPTIYLDFSTRYGHSFILRAPDKEIIGTIHCVFTEYSKNTVLMKPAPAGHLIVSQIVTNFSEFAHAH